MPPMLNLAPHWLCGITPNQFYELVRRQGHAGLAAQAQGAGFAHHNFWIEYVASLDAKRVA
jgi:hypothetical protein